ncbi:unnamed protein product [Gongylonema pulchrum]|uniref:Ion_trans_2 domain-containing protein n=1 Tax=Gongylonema pulchrum TaxID=637853 RepID=A0A183DHA1_9BILA|nr:unnamed protein product [Gongylonema pulchrum]
MKPEREHSEKRKKQIYLGNMPSLTVGRIQVTGVATRDELLAVINEVLVAGFGDYRPAPQNMLVVLCVIMGGIILTTMCMDVVGRMYLKEIHYIGRKIQTNNPFFLIREAKARRRRQATASVLLELAKGMIFAHHRNYEAALAGSKRRMSKKDRKRESHLCKRFWTDYPYLFLPGG